MTRGTNHVTDQLHQVFISYSHSDSEFVNKFASLLVSCDLNVWKDTKDIIIGENIPKMIYEGIKTASHFCCVISRASVNSAWVEEELSYAKVRQLATRSLRIVPLLIDVVEIPDYVKAYRCANLQDRKLTFDNPELLMLLRAFGLNIESRITHIITGALREKMFAACNTLWFILDELIGKMREYDRARREYYEAPAYCPPYPSSPYYSSLTPPFPFYYSPLSLSAGEDRSRDLERRINAAREVYEREAETKKDQAKKFEQEVWDELRKIAPRVISAVELVRAVGADAGIKLFSVEGRQQDSSEFDLWYRLNWALYELDGICSCIVGQEIMGFTHHVGSLPLWTPRLMEGRTTIRNVAGVLESWSVFDRDIT